MDIEAYPLCWPSTWKRTDRYHHKVAHFATHSLASARDYVLNELRKMGAKNVIISSNVRLRLDGLPRSTQATPEDPGVAVYFELKGENKVLACDLWHRVQDNLWAIGKHIEAIRGQERWGVGTINQAFMGYNALPSPQTSWWIVLEVDRDADFETIREAYRKKVKNAHPDTGGSEEEFILIQTAWNDMREERGG
jgi:hypothetical protein